MENLNEEKNNQSKLLLNSIYQNTQTALQSINDATPSIKDNDLLSELSRQEIEYSIISKECEMISRSVGINVKDNTILEKIKLWSGVKMSTLCDNSTSHIAEMFLIGSFMGVITCIKDEKEHSRANDEILSLLKKLKSFQENNIEILKSFL
jgi:hypothetical protein